MRSSHCRRCVVDLGNLSGIRGSFQVRDCSGKPSSGKEKDGNAGKAEKKCSIFQVFCLPQAENLENIQYFTGYTGEYWTPQLRITTSDFSVKIRPRSLRSSLGDISVKVALGVDETLKSPRGA